MFNHINTFPALLMNYQWIREQKCNRARKTKIIRASCRRRAGIVVPRAEKFGELMTADHKVLSEGCESRNNDRHAVVVQDWATRWIQSYKSKTKTSQETQKNLMKKVIYTDKSLEFGKSCE